MTSLLTRRSGKFRRMYRASLLSIGVYNQHKLNQHSFARIYTVGQHHWKASKTYLTSFAIDNRSGIHLSHIEVGLMWILASFHLQTVCESWNRLPEDIVNASPLNISKNKLYLRVKIVG